MLMRSAALVLVVTLVAPAAAMAACEMFCASEAHHTAAAAAAASGCHEHHADAAGPVVAADTSGCHDNADLPSEAMTVDPQQAPAPALVPQRLTLAAPATRAVRAVSHAQAHPPDTGPLLSPLRL